MAGLTTEGFVTESLEAIKQRIENRLGQFNTGFDFSPESPDGQLIGIFSAELYLMWQELSNVYHSYNPNSATGQALRNLAQLTGVEYRTATRSYAEVVVAGTPGTVIPRGSNVSALSGHTFYTHQEVTIDGLGHGQVIVIAEQTGEVPVSMAEPINTIETLVLGWDEVHQTNEGVQGNFAEDEQHFRNVRNRTTMRNALTVEETIVGRFVSQGVDQVRVINNDINSTLPDGTPPRHIHVVLGQNNLTDQEISDIIYRYKGLGVLTHGSTTGTSLDSLGNSHDVKFTKATAKPIYVRMNVTFLSDDIAGAVAFIQRDVAEYINSLIVGQDLVWSKLFGIITPHGDAQVNSLEVSDDNVTWVSENILVSDLHYTEIIEADIAVLAN